MTHPNFVVPVIQEGELCDIDGETYSIHVRLSGSNEISSMCGFNSHFLWKKGIIRVLQSVKIIIMCETDSFGI